MPEKYSSIRLFVSSTFADMQDERSYLTGTIVPAMENLCSSYGLNFFCYDFRWGITEKQQLNSTVELCLGAIDASRPFFVGIVGDRYGWVPELTTEEKTRFGIDEDRISITEMEMLYGSLKEKVDGFCVYALREPRANVLDSRTLALRKRICDSGYPCLKDYSTVKEFGDWLLEQFKCWLEKEFDTVKDMEYKKQQSFLEKESALNIGNSEIEGNLPLWLKSGQPLFIVDKGCGMGSFMGIILNRLSRKGDFDAILVNLQVSNYLRYSESILLYVMREMSKLYPGKIREDYLQTPITQVMSEVQRRELYAYFREMWKTLGNERPIYIGILNAHLLKRELDKTFFYLSLGNSEKMNVVVTSNGCPYQNILDYSGWHVRQITMEECMLEMFFYEKLRYHRKSLSEEHSKLIRDEIGAFEDYDLLQLLIGVLFNNLTHDNLDSMLKRLAKTKEHGLLMETLGFGLYEASLNSLEIDMMYTSFLVLKEYGYALTEQDFHDVFSEIMDFLPENWCRFRMVTAPSIPSADNYIDISNRHNLAVMELYAERMSCVPKEKIDGAIIQRIHKKIEAMRDSEEVPNVEFVRQFNIYVKLLMQQNKVEEMVHLWTEDLELVTRMLLLDLTLIDRMMEAGDARMRKAMLLTFRNVFYDMRDLILDTWELPTEGFSEIWAHMMTYDKYEILEKYFTAQQYVIYKKTSEEFQKLYLDMLRGLAEVRSQQMLDTWYTKASCYLTPYIKGSGTDSLLAFDLISLYAVNYASAAFAEKMAGLYFFKAMREGDSEMYLQSLQKLSQALEKGAEQKTAGGLMEEYQRLKRNM